MEFAKGSFSLYLHSVVLDLLRFGSNLVSNIQGGMVVFRAFLIGVPMQISNMLGENVVEVFNSLEKPPEQSHLVQNDSEGLVELNGLNSTWILGTLPIAVVFHAEKMWSLCPLGGFLKWGYPQVMYC